jgi:hypothetical protein
MNRWCVASLAEPRSTIPRRNASAGQVKRSARQRPAGALRGMPLGAEW